MMPDFADIHYMKSAIAMARRGQGRTSPNPSVGCVIVKNGVVLARARTADDGRPHAETIALEQAAGQARGASLYVTLEPCAHHGKTPPCVDNIIKAGISRVIIGVIDPDKRVSGRGVQSLKEADIAVLVDVLGDDCRTVHSGFITRITKNRPFVTLKTACTLDGKIALASGESKWITGALARRHVHQLRARSDSILIGIETALADDPILTCHSGSFLGHDPLRVVLDKRLRISQSSKLVLSAKEVPLMVFHAPNIKQSIYNDLEKSGVILRQIPSDGNLVPVLDILAHEGVNTLLVEGGATVHGSFLRQGLCDELLIYRSATILGAMAKSAFSDIGVETLAQRYDLKLSSRQKLGHDVLERYII